MEKLQINTTVKSAVAGSTPKASSHMAPAIVRVDSSMTTSTMRIAPAENELLNGEMAASKRDYDTAIAHLDRAVRYQDAQVCNGAGRFGSTITLTLSRL